eukprot:GEMP01051290.1.p1 GENE.GEMP01051290.1~~GEMP01051290.1.p1  ORF type:complete len:157 (+),score=31.55 GEMP01051290.1:35-505(+)
MATSHVRVGVATILVREGTNGLEILVGERHGSHGAGTWALPGGHLEMEESWEECATREVAEETGLRIADWRFGFLSNDIMTSEGKHYITIFIEHDCRGKTLNPQLLEPNKCKGWEWLTIDELSQKAMFLPLKHLLEAYQAGKYKPFDTALPAYSGR